MCLSDRTVFPWKDVLYREQSHSYAQKTHAVILIIRRTCVSSGTASFIKCATRIQRFPIPGRMRSCGTDSNYLINNGVAYLFKNCTKAFYLRSFLYYCEYTSGQPQDIG